MIIAFHTTSHITSICTSYLSLLTRKHSKVSSHECLRVTQNSSMRERLAAGTVDMARRRIPSAGVTCMMNPRWRRQLGKKLERSIMKSRFLDILNGLLTAANVGQMDFFENRSLLRRF